MVWIKDNGDGTNNFSRMKPANVEGWTEYADETHADVQAVLNPEEVTLSYFKDFVLQPEIDRIKREARLTVVPADVWEGLDAGVKTNWQTYFTDLDDIYTNTVAIPEGGLDGITFPDQPSLTP